MKLAEIREEAERLSTEERMKLIDDLLRCQDIENSWAILAKKRLEELKCGEVKGIEWEELKSRVVG